MGVQVPLSVPFVTIDYFITAVSYTKSEHQGAGSSCDFARELSIRSRTEEAGGKQGCQALPRRSSRLSAQQLGTGQQDVGRDAQPRMAAVRCGNPLAPGGAAIQLFCFFDSELCYSFYMQSDIPCMPTWRDISRHKFSLPSARCSTIRTIPSAAGGSGDHRSNGRLLRRRLRVSRVRSVRLRNRPVGH